MTAATAAGICTKNRRKHPFSLLLVVQPTIPNGPLYPPGPITPENTPESGATAPNGRRTGVEKGGCVLARVGSPKRALDPAQALHGEILSGGSDPHRIRP